jgi:hypothetical protein
MTAKVITFHVYSEASLWYVEARADGVRVSETGFASMDAALAYMRVVVERYARVAPAPHER